jgi:hypothetical protein
MPLTKIRGFGWLPDPPDDGRDEPHHFAHLVSRLGAPILLPEEASMQRHVRSVLEQGPLNSCVANAGFQAMRMRRSALGTDDPLGARHFGYFVSRADHGMADFDLGTHNRSFFRGVAKFGFLAEDDYPYGYDWLRANTPPPPVAYHRAFDHRRADEEPLLSYRRIHEEGEERIDRIMQALALDMPTVFGTQVSHDFVDGIDIEAHVQDPPLGKAIAGGHAMVIVAYNGKGHFLVLSSWGERWGIRGYCWMSADYLMWALSRDLWVIDRPPLYIPPRSKHR